MLHLSSPHASCSKTRDVLQQFTARLLIDNLILKTATGPSFPWSSQEIATAKEPLEVSTSFIKTTAKSLKSAYLRNFHQTLYRMPNQSYFKPQRCAPFSEFSCKLNPSFVNSNKLLCVHHCSFCTLVSCSKSQSNFNILALSPPFASFRQKKVPSQWLLLPEARL